GGDEVRGDLDVVVEVQEEPRRGGRELVDRAHAGVVVVLVRVLDDAGLRAEAGDHRHLARERGAEGVDGLDAKAMPDVAGVLELGENPAAHLARRLDGEGDGYHLLGLLHRAEEPDVALHQELGLARAGGRLDDEGAARVEGGFARGGVGEFFDGQAGYSLELIANCDELVPPDQRLANLRSQFAISSSYGVPSVVIPVEPDPPLRQIGWRLKQGEQLLIDIA